MDIDNPFSGMQDTVSSPPSAPSQEPPVDLGASQVCRIELSGVQTVRSIRAVHFRLTDELARNQAIEIDCNAVTELDLSLIQLLLAAKRSADKVGKSFTLAAPAAGPLRDSLDRAGFLAAGESSTAAFWLKGSNAP